jgi:hypothetical protein
VILGTFALTVRIGRPTILFPLKISPAITKFVMNASVKTSTESANNSVGLFEDFVSERSERVDIEADVVGVEKPACLRFRPARECRAFVRTELAQRAPSL